MAEPAPASVPGDVSSPVRLTTAELAARERWSKQYNRVRPLRGLPPRFIKAGAGKNGRVLYDLREVERFEKERTFSSTTESQARENASGA